MCMHGQSKCWVVCVSIFQHCLFPTLVSHNSMETVNGGCPTPQYSDPCSNGGSKPLSQQSMALAAAVRSGNISVSSAQADDFVTFKEAMQLAERAKQKAEAKYRAEAGGRT